MSYYSAHVKVTESAVPKIAIDTVSQGDDLYCGMRSEESS